MARSTRWFLLVAMLLSLAVAPLSARASLPPATAHDLVLLRAGSGAGATLVSLPVGDDRAGVRLPIGLLDPTGHVLYATSAVPGHRTLLRAIDTATGATLRSLVLHGDYLARTGDYSLAPLAVFNPDGTLQGYRAHGGIAASPQRGGIPADTAAILATLSFNGRWLALRDIAVSTAQTHILVIDTAAMRVVASQEFQAQYGLDAISADGSLLYLIEPLYQYGQDAYQVRLYRPKSGILDPTPVRERGEKPGSMNGIGWTRVWSPDGSWLFTLYVEDSGHVFIHALGIATREVHCIDLPDVPAPFTEMSHYTLSIAPDGRSLYAVNTAIGQAVAVRGGLPLGSIHAVHVAIQAGPAMPTRQGAAITADGSTLFVATDHGIWVVSPGSMRMSGQYLADRSFAGVALSRDGQRLYALERDTGFIDVLDPTSGQLLGMAPVEKSVTMIEAITGA